MMDFLNGCFGVSGQLEHGVYSALVFSDHYAGLVGRGAEGGVGGAVQFRQKHGETHLVLLGARQQATHL